VAARLPRETDEPHPELSRGVVAFPCRNLPSEINHVA